MLRLLTFLSLLALASCAFMQDCFRQPGPHNRVERNLSQTARMLRLTGGTGLFFSTGLDSAKLVVEGNEHLLPQLATDQAGPWLQVEDRNQCDGLRGYGYFARLLVPSQRPWRHIQLVGHGDVNADDTLRSDTLRVDHYTAANVRLDIMTKWFIADLTSSGKFWVGGRTNHMEIFTALYTRYDANACLADSVYIYHRGKQDITIRASRLLYVEMDGDGDINYYGDPVVLFVYKSGLGKVRRLGA